MTLSRAEFEQAIQSWLTNGIGSGTSGLRSIDTADWTLCYSVSSAVLRDLSTDLPPLAIDKLCLSGAAGQAARPQAGVLSDRK